MISPWLQEAVERSNLVLLGEAGCGKSEIAVNLSVALLPLGKPLHLFDLDMTKPLFRSRDERAQIEKMGVQFHFEEQFADAPTIAGGVVHQLKNTESYTVLDVGGDHIGARAIGGYASYLNRDDTVIYYIINPYRPWSQTAAHAGSILSQVLAVTHIRPERIRFIGNPNVGEATTLKDVLTGYEKIGQMMENGVLSCLCVREELADKAAERVPLPVFPIKRYIAYPWQ